VLAHRAFFSRLAQGYCLSDCHDFRISHENLKIQPLLIRLIGGAWSPSTASQLPPTAAKRPADTRQASCIVSRHPRDVGSSSNRPGKCTNRHRQWRRQAETSGERQTISPLEGVGCLCSPLDTPDLKHDLTQLYCGFLARQCRWRESR